MHDFYVWRASDESADDAISSDASRAVSAASRVASVSAATPRHAAAASLHRG